MIVQKEYIHNSLTSSIPHYFAITHQTQTLGLESVATLLSYAQPKITIEGYTFK